MNMSWQIYMLRCRDRSLYTGITKDIDKRLRQHQTGNGSKYVKTRRPAELVYIEPSESRSTALKREAQIKKLSRAAKWELIRNQP